MGLPFLGLLLRSSFERDRVLIFAVRDLFLVALLCGIASLVTPYGPGLFVYVWRTQFSSQLSGFVLEWQSPDFHTRQMLPFLAVLLLVFIGFAWKRPRLHDVLLTLGATILALRAWFFIPVFVVATTPILVWQWSEPWSRLSAWLRTTPLGRPREWLGEALV